MAQLPIKEYHFGSDIRYLGKLEPFKSSGLFTDKIYFKTLPGFGATFWEIHFQRHSIIIEPYVPVILGKQAKHPEILGVHRDISNTQIREYLNSDVPYKKIMTTPEGYKRVKTIIKSMHANYNLYNDFFLLFDECDRLITDKDYRGQISLPMNDFFNFKNKALISATALMPSDKRFAENNFAVVKLIPDFDYKQKVNLIITNNIIESLREKLKSLGEEKPIFIFLNSTLTINTVITLLDIESESKVFCSEDSRIILHDLGISNTSSTLGAYCKYNFFTSRFFSAVDIELDYKPDVIMISDLINAKHSMLDPSTEIIQITGRFRKSIENGDLKTTNSITHITNLKPSMKYWGKSEAKKFLNNSFTTFDKKRLEIEKAEKDNLDEVDVQSLRDEFKSLPFNEYILLNGEIDYFLVDNYLHKQRVKSYYINVSTLEQAYKSSKYFDIETEVHQNPISDEDDMKLAKAKTKIKQTKIVADKLAKLTVPDDYRRFNFSNKELQLKFLREKFPDATKAFFTIGYGGMEDKEFMLHKMKDKVDKVSASRDKLNLSLINRIFELFVVNKFYSEVDIRKTLNLVYLEFTIDLKVFPKDIKFWFEISNRTSNSEGLKGYKILSRRNVEDIQNS